MPCSAHRALGPAAAAAAAAKPDLQRDQIHAAGSVLVGCRRRGDTAAHRSLRHRHRHSAGQAPRRVQGIPPPRPGRAGGARRGPGPVDRRAHRARARLRGDAEIEVVGRGSRFSVEVPRANAVAAAPNCARRNASISAGSTARSRSASTTSAPFSTAWKRCSAAGAAACSKPPISPKRWPRSRPAALEPDGLLVDYHLDGGNGIAAIARIAPPPRPSCAGDPDHRRPLAARARGSPRRRRRTCSTSRSSRRRCAR